MCFLLTFSKKSVCVEVWFFCVQRITIKDLEHDGDLEQKLFSVQVVQKSGLRTYKTKQKKMKYFFYLGVADETGYRKVMVYGQERYQDFKVDQCYGLRQVIKEKDILKVTKRSKVSKVKPLNVGDDLKLKAQMIIYSQAPLCSIAKAKEHKDRTTVSVEGTIKEVRTHVSHVFKHLTVVHSDVQFCL